MSILSFSKGARTSKTTLGIVLIMIWAFLQSKYPSLAENLPFLDELLYAYTGIAAVDRAQKVIDK